MFIIMATTGVMLINNVSKASKKVEMEQYLYTEEQALLERITRTIQDSGVDYEEYYSHNVIQSLSTNPTYGINYGAYHQQFFNPSTGFETGKNPYEGSGQSVATANAVCEGATTCTNTQENYQLDEIYLINRSGNKKTIFVLEEGAISLVELEGFDQNGDGIPDTWTCTNEFNCTMQNPETTDTSYKLPLPDDKRDGQRDTNNFTTISPQNIVIDNFIIYLSPIEDPYKGYNEVDASVLESVQIHPKITIVMKAHYQILDSSGQEIPFEQSGNYIGTAPEITLQTTVGTGIYSELSTYHP